MALAGLASCIFNYYVFAQFHDLDRYTTTWPQWCHGAEGVQRDTYRSVGASTGTGLAELQSVGDGAASTRIPEVSYRMDATLCQ